MAHFVGARLRQGFDDDLIKATKNMDSHSKSELLRTGLRMALGIRTHKVTQVIERPIEELICTSPSLRLRRD